MFLYNLLISCINHSWPSMCLSISVTSVIIYNSHYCPKYLVRYNKQQSRKSSNVDPQSSKKKLQVLVCLSADVKTLTSSHRGALQFSS